VRRVASAIRPSICKVFARHTAALGRPFSSWTSSKERLEARLAEAGKHLADWTPHDLRRTCATGMGEIGVQPHLVEAVLNHVSGHKHGVAGIYNHAVYAAEKAQRLRCGPIMFSRWSRAV
jgi:integrase